MSTTNAKKFSTLIGKLVQIDTNEEDQLVNTNYQRFRVDLNSHEPLIPRCKVPSIFRLSINLMAPNFGLNSNMQGCYNSTSIVGYKITSPMNAAFILQ